MRLGICLLVISCSASTTLGFSSEKTQNTELTLKQMSVVEHLGKKLSLLTEGQIRQVAQHLSKHNKEHGEKLNSLCSAVMDLGEEHRTEVGVRQLQLAGAKGTAGGMVNGMYQRTNEIMNGAPTYKRKDGKKWIARGTNNQWFVQDTNSKGLDGGWAYTKDKNPTPESTWRVWTGNEWETQMLDAKMPAGDVKSSNAKAERQEIQIEQLKAKTDAAVKVASLMKQSHLHVPSAISKDAQNTKETKATNSGAKAVAPASPAVVRKAAAPAAPAAVKAQPSARAAAAVPAAAVVPAAAAVVHKAATPTAAVVHKVTPASAAAVVTKTATPASPAVVHKAASPAAPVAVKAQPSAQAAAAVPAASAVSAASAVLHKAATPTAAVVHKAVTPASAAAVVTKTATPASPAVVHKAVTPASAAAVVTKTATPASPAVVHKAAAPAAPVAVKAQPSARAAAAVSAAAVVPAAAAVVHKAATPTAAVVHKAVTPASAAAMVTKTAATAAAARSSAANGKAMPGKENEMKALTPTQADKAERKPTQAAVKATPADSKNNPSSLVLDLGDLDLGESNPASPNQKKEKKVGLSAADKAAVLAKVKRELAASELLYGDANDSITDLSA